MARVAESFCILSKGRSQQTKLSWQATGTSSDTHTLYMYLYTHEHNKYTNRYTHTRVCKSSVCTGEISFLNSGRWIGWPKTVDLVTYVRWRSYSPVAKPPGPMRVQLFSLATWLAVTTVSPLPPPQPNTSTYRRGLSWPFDDGRPCPDLWWGCSLHFKVAMTIQRHSSKALFVFIVRSEHELEECLSSDERHL